MPQPRKHDSHALRQAAYRVRQAAARDEQLRAKGLPALPTPPQIPGRARWQSAIKAASKLLEQTVMEMNDYYENRSEQWQETQQAETLMEQIDALEGVLADLPDLNEGSNRVKINDDERRAA